MKSRFGAVLVGVAAVLVASAASAGEVKISLRDGRVTLMAQDATVREILSEWSRVGKTALVNADKLTGPPITIQLQDVPEEQALESLLRSANGYILAPRVVPVAGASVIERILVYPIAARSVSAASSAAPVARPADVGGQGQGAPFGRGRLQPGNPDDENVVGSPRMMMGPGGPGGSGPGMRGTEGPQGAGGVVNGRPVETSFDYANPMQFRQYAEQALGAAAGGNTVGGVVTGVASPTMQGTNPAGVAFPNPYSSSIVNAIGETQSVWTPGAAVIGTGSATRPGVTVSTPNSVVGPYGLPASNVPGTAVGTAQTPDRSKYINPPKPPETTTGGGRGGR